MPSVLLPKTQKTKSTDKNSNHNNRQEPSTMQEEAPQKTNQQTKLEAQNTHSNTKVHFSKKSAYKYMSGERKPISIRIDTGLYSVFKSVSKRVFGSTCKAVEVYMITLIETAENGVHFCNTDETRVVIEKLIIERNLSKERRNLKPSQPETVQTTSEPKCDFCGKTPATASFRHTSGIIKRVCDKHEAELRNHPKWSILK